MDENNRLSIKIIYVKIDSVDHLKMIYNEDVGVSCTPQTSRRGVLHDCVI